METSPTPSEVVVIQSMTGNGDYVACLYWEKGNKIMGFKKLGFRHINGCCVAVANGPTDENISYILRNCPCLLDSENVQN